MTLEERLTKLEAENRWLKRGAAVGMVAVVAVLCMAQARPEPQTVEVGSQLNLTGSGQQKLLRPGE